MRQVFSRFSSRLGWRLHRTIASYPSQPFLQSTTRSLSSTTSSSSVRIGNVEIPLGRPPLGDATNINHDDRWLIPYSFLPSDTQLPSTFLRHLQWMMAKDLLEQDMLLVGPPGAGECYRRRLALAYAEMTQKPIEILTISGDMTESDLKQRRELFQTAKGDEESSHTTSVQFVDQAPVRAAKYGRLLLLDGLEKAERNVLPTLNNLLENREMYLEDGTLLLPHQRVKELSDSDRSSSTSWIPVHPDFRVIALAVPSPPFPGRSLDPPIRSRFQIRRIDNPASEQLYERIVLDNDLTSSNSATTNPKELTLARSCAVFAGAMDDKDNLFPSHHLGSIWRVLRDFPAESPLNVLHRAFPNAKTDRIHDWSRYFDTPEAKPTNVVSDYVIKKVERGPETDNQYATVTLETMTSLPPKTSSINVSCGRHLLNGTSSPYIVHTDGFQRALAAMIQEHGSGGRDILLTSPKGEGKNALAQEFAAMLGYETHLFAIYSEMSSQDLLLRRGTDSTTGETMWDETPLIRAARRGDLCILDGIEKLRPDVLSSIQSLITDRFMQLPDGRRLIHHEHIAPNNSCDNNSVKSVVLVHPSFRIVALASTSKESNFSVGNFLTPSHSGMFSCIELSAPTEECLRAILRQASNHRVSDESIDSILALRKLLNKSVADDCGVAQLSTRNMIRAVRRVGKENGNDLYRALFSVFLFDLLPPRQRSILESVLKQAGISPSIANQGDEQLEVAIDGDIASIGSLKIQRARVNRPELVPSPNAVDIPSHIRIIRDVLQDWKNGERYMLLLGNQGVGKNKIVDRICEIASFEREYIQLHRDSTIGQLTLTPQLEDGKIVWNDSPLIKAVTNGCVLVVDEADKAPVEVVSVLKGLVEDGELLLADGRRISTHNQGPDLIPIHPNFCLWVLANRPGMPFLGNDFFREIGDCFSVRVISNPDLDSEMDLLRAYAPSLEERSIRSIASSFAELRQFSDNGDISYPYSTREAIAVVKHLERFPSDDVVAALHNVLDFDSYDEQTYSLLGKVFQRHGIPVSDYPSWMNSLGRSSDASDARANGDLRIEYLYPNGRSSSSHNPPSTSMPKFGKWDDNNEVHVGGNQWAGGSGGSDTAGLGGRGGPFRLDRGHKVHQVSDEAKAEISKEAQDAAREIAKKALQDRLEEIGMGHQEWEMYERFANPIKDDIAKLRGILHAMELRSLERGWLKRQSYGEIDDTKLIDGVTGDKYIYKRRGSMEDAPLQRKKRIRFVMDCSGSMYRFNGYDQRLVRCLEAALLIMESFDGFGDSKFEYSIVGHSGDSPCIPFVNWAEPPKNEMDRMRVLQSMLAHSQYCMSGDFTMEAIGNAIDKVAGFGDEDGTVICLSDANLARYGIDPRQLGNVIQAGNMRGVNAYVVFIASFGEEAQNIKRALPAGRGYICMETSDLPKIVRDILTSRILKYQ
ncbi:ATPase AAA [Nitzschia inconspicua]|uniref:ATPase AAA n=1 Tax=Nitzschia inconspicua TaxID=303405 RepID=A0A9K3L1C8_9STRA|nr:ATPase AAA [Nitzschia inconspicua]